MKLLFLTHPYPNYVPDLLLHGLRKTLGPDVVDYPRKDCLYNGVLGLGVCPPNQLCPGWFPADAGHVDREDVPTKLKRGYFDLVVADWRTTLEAKTDWTSAAKRLVLIDGEDQPAPIPPGNYIICRRETDGSDFSVPLPMALPEEIFNWIVSYDFLPKKYSIGFLGSTHDDRRRQLIEKLASIYPNCLFSASAVPAENNPFPEGRYGRDEYYQELQRCRLVLSLPGAGYDTFRFWENAACNAVHASQRMPIRIPDDFTEGLHLLRFGSIDELRIQVDLCLEGKVELAAEARFHLYRHHLTQHRARYFLDALRRLCPSKRIPVSAVAEMESGDLERTLNLTHANPLHPPHSLEHTLYLGLVEGNNYGWGVCSHYLIKELFKLTNCRVLNATDGSAQDGSLGGKLFHALTGVDFFPMFEKARGRQNYGYTFFENELTRQSLKNAKRYDLILCGSSWCRDRMLERSITNCGVLIQGIDPELFFPVDEDKDPERFVIFSGGKFELRKGQDLVLKAFKILQDKYPDMWLVNCWYNIWPESMQLMARSPYIRFEMRSGSWQELMAATYALNGLDSSRIVTCDLMPAELQRELYRNTDIGVFPNRCEGGTNLVLMEYMACGKPAVVSYTSGHTDIATESNALLLKELKNYSIAGPGRQPIARWQEPSVDELVTQIEYAYHHRNRIKETGRIAGEDMQRLTWEQSARTLYRILFPEAPRSTQE